jgi:hypothetical protein
MAGRNRTYALLISLSTAIILGLTFYLTRYICSEGFNPSDDGVVLAQSFRIINGEKPHIDFISIRPVFSGILHTLNFYTPFPLIISGRIFSLLEYYIYSVLWVYLLISLFLKGTRKDYFHIFLPLIFVSFLLNLNTYHLYPWTTIDGILFTIIGFFFFFKSKDLTKNTWKTTFLVIALLSVSLASLSKQNFIFTALFLYILIIIDLIKKKKISSLTITILIGASPYYLYFIYLVINNGVDDFIRQMTGRTELIKAGILRYGIVLVRSKLIIINVLVFYILLLDFFTKSMKYKTEKRWRAFMTFNNTKFLNIVAGIYLILTIIIAFWFILHNKYHSLPFEFFWILALLFLISVYTGHISKEQALLNFSALLLAWTASISLGANTPVYTTGIMVSMIIILIYNLYKKNMILPLTKRYHLLLYIPILVIMHAFFFSYTFGQRKYNYRELASKHLKYNLGELIPEFGGVKTDKNTFDYYSEFTEIYNDLNLKNNFVLLPNNAIIYPLLNSKNPFPLDWIQGAEFIGSEEKVISSISDIIRNNDIYILVDRFDSKEMANGFREKEYDTINYPYMQIIEENCVSIPRESKYFSLYRSIN